MTAGPLLRISQMMKLLWTLSPSKLLANTRAHAHTHTHTPWEKRWKILENVKAQNLLSPLLTKYNRTGDTVGCQVDKAHGEQVNEPEGNTQTAWHQEWCIVMFQHSQRQVHGGDQSTMGLCPLLVCAKQSQQKIRILNKLPCLC